MPVPAPSGPDLSADCARCFALCCVAPAFAVSADFALDKPAGRPCPNLAPHDRCAIHGLLREEGFGGCAAYDCFGAGQRVSQETFQGVHWRGRPEVARQMFAAFAVMRQLHELLWHLAEAATLPGAEQVRGDIAGATSATQDLATGGAARLLALDVGSHRAAVNVVLVAASELARAARGGIGRDWRGADLIGADLRREELRNASLRGARLVGADLRGAQLGYADLTGADLRGADVRGARLVECLFLTQAQLDTARGDADTALAPGRNRPRSWP